MPKKSGKKSSNKDSRNITTASHKDPPITEHIGCKRNENIPQTTSTLVNSEASNSSEFRQPIDAQTVSENKKYSKRKIESNWQRYEIPDESSQLPDTATIRGYDFEFLKNAGGVIGSHFQFQDEKDWEEDSDSLNQLQSLDLNSLALSLSCIPFHQLLGIDSKYFTAEQIRKFEATAQQQEVKYLQKTVALEKQERKSGNVKSPVESGVMFSTENNDSRESVSCGDFRRNKRESVSMKTFASQLHVLKTTPDNKTPMDDELEDELDALLALNSEKVQNMCIIDITKLTLTPEHEYPTTSIVKSVPEITAIPGESLEHWLDSALED